MPILAVYSQATRPLVEANMNVERWSDVYLWPTYLIMYFKSQVTLVYSVLPRNNFFVCRNPSTSKIHGGIDGWDRRDAPEPLERGFTLLFQRITDYSFCVTFYRIYDLALTSTDCN